MKCYNCKDELKSIRGKSGLCQPCSARAVMHKRWGSLGDVSKGSLRYLDVKTQRWLLNEANTNKVRLSVLVAGIIKDAYNDEMQQR